MDAAGCWVVALDHDGLQGQLRLRQTQENLTHKKDPLYPFLSG